MVQLDQDEEMGPLHGMYGTLDAELEVHWRPVERRNDVHWPKSKGCRFVGLDLGGVVQS